jgi:hypothetical protein
MELQQMLDKREEARRARDYDSADRIRDDLRMRGVRLDDRSKTWQSNDGRSGTFDGSGGMGGGGYGGMGGGGYGGGGYGGGGGMGGYGGGGYGGGAHTHLTPHIPSTPGNPTRGTSNPTMPSALASYPQGSGTLTSARFRSFFAGLSRGTL